MRMKPEAEAAQPAIGVQESMDSQLEAAVREVLSKVPGDITQMLRPRLNQLVTQGNRPGELVSYAEALQELGPERLLGPDARNRAFDGLDYTVDTNTVPFLPGKWVRKVKELSERVPGLNPRIVFHAPTGPGGLPVTAQNSHEWWKKFNPRERLLYSADESDCWYKDESAYKTEGVTKVPQWRLATELVPGSTGKNYLDETICQDKFAVEHLSDVLPDHVRMLLDGEIKDLDQGQEYGQMIRALVESVKKADAWTQDQRIAAMLLTHSVGNKLLRPTLARVIDTSFVARRNGQDFLRNTWTRTNEVSVSCVLFAGDCTPHGAYVRGCKPYYRGVGLGASLSVEVA